MMIYIRCAEAVPGSHDTGGVISSMQGSERKISATNS